MYVFVTPSWHRADMILSLRYLSTLLELVSLFNMNRTIFQTGLCCACLIEKVILWVALLYFALLSEEQ